MNKNQYLNQADVKEEISRLSRTWVIMGGTWKKDLENEVAENLWRDYRSTCRFTVNQKI